MKVFFWNIFFAHNCTNNTCVLKVLGVQLCCSTKLITTEMIDVWVDKIFIFTVFITKPCAATGDPNLVRHRERGVDAAKDHNGGLTLTAFLGTLVYHAKPHNSVVVAHHLQEQKLRQFPLQLHHEWEKFLIARWKRSPLFFSIPSLEANIDVGPLSVGIGSRQDTLPNDVQTENIDMASVFEAFDFEKVKADKATNEAMQQLCEEEKDGKEDVATGYGECRNKETCRIENRASTSLLRTEKDFSKAYEIILRESMYKVLQEVKIPPKIGRIIRALTGTTKVKPSASQHLAIVLREGRVWMPALPTWVVKPMAAPHEINIPYGEPDKPEGAKT
uniref:(California timema) hypothetical protein n=1 Tax=Timema californicum TaxID=61474 RepID=A0A7R9P4R9_TIMCA|nr:unnamed protein product [Timema californicum]